MLSAFGVQLKREGPAVTIQPVEKFTAPQEIEVPGDISSAAYWLVAGSIVPGSKLLLKNVGINPTRTGILDVLKDMGAKITLQNERTSGGEAAADMLVEYSELHGVSFGAEIMPRLIDEIPIIAVAALCAKGDTVITGAGELRVKETDRLMAIAKEFNKLAPGAIEEKEDGLIIHGNAQLKDATAFSYDDHRIAMSLAILGTAGNGVEIENILSRILSDFGGSTEMKNLVVAIDGPAGAGKSTVSQLAAKKLGYTYIDTGAMYRAVAWKTLQQHKEVTDELILDVVKDIDVDLQYKDGKTTVAVDGTDVTGEIRTPEVSAIVSQVAALGPVREKMVDLQRKMGERGSVLMDGRDIATNVLPNADVKIFLTASIEERARRRHKELTEKGYAIDMEQMKADIAARDKADSEREISPLVQAADATLLDTTGLSIDEVVDRILAMCQ